MWLMVDDGGWYEGVVELLEEHIDWNVDVDVDGGCELTANSSR